MQFDERIASCWYNFLVAIYKIYGSFGENHQLCVLFIYHSGIKSPAIAHPDLRPHTSHAVSPEYVRTLNCHREFTWNISLLK